MISTEHWLVHDHTRLEVLLNDMVNHADIRDWHRIDQQVREFIILMDHHMGQEEEVLFLAYELKTGGLNQPVRNLIEEHEYIADIVREIVNSIAVKDIDSLKDGLSYLGNMIKSHHEKEEMLFLPMASHILFDEREKLSTRLNEYPGSSKQRNWGV